MTADSSSPDPEILAELYAELRRLAGQRLKRERPGQTLQATALVHEALLRVGVLASQTPRANQREVFLAAAEAMRRILIEKARRRRRGKHGGGLERVALSQVEPAGATAEEFDVELLDRCLARLQSESPERADVVRLRFFGGHSMPQVAEILGISLATAERRWSVARAWLHRELTRLPGAADESGKF